MLHQCASCHSRVFSTIQKLTAGSGWPIVCPVCGALNTPSAEAAVFGSILGSILILLAAVALEFRSWLAFTAALVLFAIGSAAPIYFMPLVLVTPQSVRVNRALLVIVVFFAVLLVWWGFNGHGP